MTSRSGLRTFSLAACLFVVHGADGWPDCDAKPATADGPHNSTFLSTVNNGLQVWAQYPTDALPQGQKGWPVVIFLHALNLGWEWYQPQVLRWASHGFVVIFPFIQSASADDHVYPIVSDSYGKNLKQALDFVRGISSGAIAAPAGLQGNLDLTNMAWAGHNMGAASAIRIAAALPQGTVKLVVAMHPFICDWSLDCKGKFHAVGKGHFCPCSAPMPSKWVSPEEQWVTTAFRTHLQHGGGADSVCGKQLWGVGAGSLSSDGNIAKKIVQRKGEAEIQV